MKAWRNTNQHRRLQEGKSPTRHSSWSSGPCHCCTGDISEQKGALLGTPHPALELLQLLPNTEPGPDPTCKETSGASCMSLQRAIRCCSDSEPAAPHTAPLSSSMSTVTQHHISGTAKVWVQHQRPVHVAIPQFNLNCSSWFKPLTGRNS